MPIFRSDKAEARVSFPPEQFGYGEGIDTVFDQSSGRHVKKPSPFRPVKFKNGEVDVNDLRVPLMRKHPGNVKNGGAIFWEQTEADTKALENLFIRTASAPEGGLTEQDKELLTALKRNCKHIAPAEVLSARERVRQAIERVRGRGIDPCPSGFTIPRIKARVIELVGLIEDKGIWSAEHEGPDTADGGSGPPE